MAGQEEENEEKKEGEMRGGLYSYHCASIY